MDNPRFLRLSPKEWLVFFALAVVSTAAWFRFGYPQFSAIDLSVGKGQALATAREFLQKRGVDHRGYLTAAVFDSDDWADTYLQKTMGLEREEEFVRRNGCEMFSWQVRFFKQFQKEEYAVEISPSSGRIIAFEHKIPDYEAREAVTKEGAQARAESFLRDVGVDLSACDFNEEKAKRLDKRTDYSFSWEKKGVYVPWKEGEGGAKLISGVTVAGNEVLSFYRTAFDLPENFFRYIDRQMYVGQYISSFSRLLFAVLMIFSVFAILARRATVMTRIIRKRILMAAGFLAAVNLLSLINDIQAVLMGYSTTASLPGYLGAYFLQSLVGICFIGFIFAIPALAGESLHEEALPRNAGVSLAHYIRSTFACRSVARAVFLGYLLFFIMLGVQAVIFFFGQKYLGVWKQWIKLTQFSSSVIPFFGAFAIGITASLTEESVFRLFGVTWSKRIFRNALCAVVFTSLAWGFGHTQYAIFPVWFRGIEVTIIGFGYGFIFLRYGIIPLIVAHYLFDVYWGVSPYILGKSTPGLLYGSLFVLALPLVFGALAFLKNGSEREREPELPLDAAQKFNLGVLAAFIRGEKGRGRAAEQIREELLRNHWDVMVVDKALADNSEVAR